MRYGPSTLRNLIFAILAVSLWVPGCATSGELRGRVYADDEARYRLGPLPRWQRLEVDARNDLAFGQPELAAVIQVNSSCNPELDIPLEALTGHLLIGFTERRIREQRRVPMAAREALRTHVVGKLDGVPREMVIHVLKKNGCVYDFALIAPPDGRFQRAQTAYERMVGGFRTERVAR